MKLLVVNEKIEYCNQCLHYDNIHSYCMVTGRYTTLKQVKNEVPYNVEIPGDCPLEDAE